MAAKAIAVAARPGADFTAGDGALAGCGKQRGCGIDLDAGANAVAAHADRRGAREHAYRGHPRGIDIRQRRIHVVAARGHQIHAVELNAQAVVRHAMHAGQAGEAPRALQAQAGDVPQQGSGVGAGGALGSHCFWRGLQRQCGGRGCVHRYGGQGRILRQGREGQGSEQGAQRCEAVRRGRRRVAPERGSGHGKGSNR